MKVIKYIIMGLGVILLAAFFWGWYIGFFKRLKIKDSEEGGFIVVGLEYTGRYSNTGKLMLNVEEKIKTSKITSNVGFGIYYDDPQVIQEDKCRSFIGHILEEKDYDKIPELISVGLKVDRIPKMKAVSTEFPLRNKMSYMIGPMKAYPAISKYMLKKGYRTSESMEIYDLKNKKISYMMKHD